MPKISKTVVDADLRKQVFDDIFADPSDTGYVKINDRQWGIILTDLNGTERYVRIGAIVAEEREDMTAKKLMESEIQAYKDTQAEKTRKAEERAKKAEADKAKREARAKEKEQKAE